MTDKHAPKEHPPVVDGRVNVPTHAEAAYPDIRYNKIASMLKQVLVTQGAMGVSILETQVKNHDDRLNRVVFGALTRGKRTSEFLIWH